MFEHFCIIEKPCNCLTFDGPHCRHICDFVYYSGTIRCKKTIQMAFAGF